MVRIKDHENTNLIETEATGELKSEDFERMWSVVKDKLDNYDKLNWLFVTDDLEGWSLDAMLKDTRFGLNYRTSFDRIAVVADQEREKVLTNLMNPFTSADVKNFSTADRSVARDWVEQAVKSQTQN